MEKNLVFGIDCDEVLRCTIQAMINVYNRELNQDMKVGDVNDFIVENSFPLVQELTGKGPAEWFFQDHSRELFVESNTINHTMDAINILKKYGKIVIITYQKSFKNKFETLEWLQKNDIYPDGVCFLKDKTIVHTDYLIDDNDWNFIGSNVKHGILINAPYNIDKDEKLILKQSNMESLTRYNSLYDFAKDFDFKMQELENNEKKIEYYYV